MNPWWECRDWEGRDKQLVESNSMKIRWIPDWLKRISLKPFSLNFLVGPRQVGKTTGIKLMIKKLAEKSNPY
ncbi:MAG: ATP-binding protein, partial [Candidatus Diapherotrites archaeon]|nr:ATP-binding protein [Candidatus Diapherotrites archaeon]